MVESPKETIAFSGFEFLMTQNSGNDLTLGFYPGWRNLTNRSLAEFHWNVTLTVESRLMPAL
jgi:hypothetical protein